MFRQQRLKRTFPTRTQRWNAQRTLQLLSSMARKIEQCVSISHRDALGTIRYLFDCIACANLTLLEYAEIETGAVMGNEKSRHVWLIHSNAQSIARYAGLRDFEKSAADSIAVADAHPIIRQILYREVFAKLPKDKIVPAQVRFPIAVRFRLINQHRTMLAPVPSEIPLSIAVHIQMAHHAPTMHWLLPDTGVYGLTAPGDVARHTYVD
jgi:hypothetical protein